MKLDEPNIFSYVSGIDVDYDTEYPCQNGSDCCDNDYCRCGEIVNIQIKIDNFLSVVEHLIEKFEAKSDLDKYAVDRIARQCELYNPEYWECEAQGGYYGDELGDTSISAHIWQKLVDKLKVYSECKNDKDKIECLLFQEYNIDLSDNLINKRWEEAEISPTEITIGNPMQFARAVRNSDFYKDYPFYVCLCRQTGKKITLVDGYHRLAAHTDAKKVKILLAK